MLRRPAAPEPAEKRICVSPELIDLTADEEDFQPPRRVCKARSLESWLSRTTVPSEANNQFMEELAPPPVRVPFEVSGTSESLDVNIEDARSDLSSTTGKEKRYYYLNNFWKVAQTVEDTYGGIFLPSERANLQKLRALPDGALRLFIRLIGRGATWFRFSDLESRYMHEVSSIEESVKVLASEDLAVLGTVKHLETPEVLREVLDAMKKEEVNAVLSGMRCGCRSTAKKADVVAQLLALVAKPPMSVTGQPLAVLSSVLDAAGRVVALHSEATSFCQRLFRLFFLADGLDHQELFKADANILRFPKYSLSGTGSLFPTRMHLSAWEESRLVQQRLDSAVQSLKDKTARDEARTACVSILLDAVEWLLCASNELNDPLFLGGSKTTPSVGLGDAVRAALGSERTLSECLVKSKISFAEAEVLVAKRPVFVRYTPGHILARLAWDVIDAVLQKEKSYSVVNTYLRLLLSTPFGFSKRGEWWLRLITNFKHLKNLEAALVMAEVGLRDPAVRTGFRHALQEHVLALAKPPRRWKVPVFPPITTRKAGRTTIIRSLLTRATGKKSRFRGLGGAELTVEEVALEHYAQSQPGQPRWKGVHAENGVWAMLFSLLLWDAIWADVPDVFHSPFQSAPLDWGLDCFYETRKDVVEKCLLRIQSVPLEELIMEAWSHEGERCVGCSWQNWAKEELIEIASCIGPRPLAQVLRLLAVDFKSRMGGLPDLLLWSPETLTWDEIVPRPAAKLVEVKGPNDHLSDKQEVWISELLAAGVHVEVCHVAAQIAPLGRAPSAPAALGTR